MVLAIPTMFSLYFHQARLVKVKNVSADVSERQALSNLIRCSSSREPIMKYDSLSTVISRVDVGSSLAGLEHSSDISLFPSGWERPENRLNRLLSCAGMSKLLEWFLLFLRTGASSHAALRKFCREAAFYGGRPADDPPYTATARLWKVEVTASNV
jgi:hypothetical protein